MEHIEEKKKVVRSYVMAEVHAKQSSGYNDLTKHEKVHRIFNYYQAATEKLDPEIRVLLGLEDANDLVRNVDIYIEEFKEEFGAQEAKDMLMLPGWSEGPSTTN